MATISSRTWTVEIISVTGLPHLVSSGDSLLESQSFSSDKQEFDGRKSYGNANEMKLRPSISEHQYLNRGTTTAGPEDSGKKVVRYVMLVKDIGTNETWKVDHRYSDFLRLRKSLLKQKFYSIPTIKSKSSLLHQQVIVVKDRVIVLQRFINDCIHIVGLSNIALHDFLINGDHYSSSSKNERYSHYSNRSSHGLHPYDDVPSQMGSTRGRSFRVVTPVILSSKTNPSNLDSDLLQVESKSYLSASSLRAVWDHIYAIPISLCGDRSQCLQHNNALIDKLISLERQVTTLHQSLLIEKERSSSPLLDFLYRSLYSILGIEEFASQGKVRTMTSNNANDPAICDALDVQIHRRRNWLLIVEVLLFRSFLTFIAFELFTRYIPHVEYYHSYDIPSMTIKQSILNVSPTLTSSMNPEGKSIPKGLFMRIFPGALAWLLDLAWSSSSYSYLHDMISQLFHLFIKFVAFCCISLPGNQNIRRQLLWLILFFITMHTLYFAHCHGVLQQLKQLIHTLVASVQIYSEQENQQVLSRLIKQASRRLVGTINVLSNEFGNWGSYLILFILIDFLPFLFNILLSDVMIISFKCILFCENIVFEVKNVLLDIAIVSQKTFIASVIFLFLSIGFIYFFFQYKYSARALYLYLLGTIVMIIYLWVTLIGMIFEDILSNQSKQSLFQQIDVLIAPFVVSRLKQHKSIFIKFGQYLSNKTSAFSPKVNEERNGNVMKVELPLSNVWFHYLQQLQDDCEFDDISITQQHHSCLKTIVEKQLNKVYEKVVLDKPSVTGSSATVLKSSEPIKLEDIFESFDPIPVASASVGQVHFATLNVDKLSNIRCKSSSDQEVGKSELNKTLGDSSIEIGSLSELIDREKQKLLKQFYTIPWFSSFAHASPVTNSSPCSDISAAASRWRWKPFGDYSGNVLQVAVKIQHLDIEDIMLQDMKVVQSLVFVASLFDVRWKPLSGLLESWKSNLVNELDFRKEADNMETIGRSFSQVHLGVITPISIPGLIFKSMLVMTCLHGYKINDDKVLSFHEINREAFVRRLVHAFAQQFLVTGLVNAHPHQGNFRICLGYDFTPKEVMMASRDQTRPSRRSDTEVLSDNSDVDNAESEASGHLQKTIGHTCVTFGVGQNVTILPGLLDFGTIVRIAEERKRLYCQFILALYERDVPTAEAALEKLGYENIQTSQLPEHSIEFFYHFFRDCVRFEDSGEAHLKVLRNPQSRRELDVQHLRDPSGRIVAKLPFDFIYIARLVVMTRKLCDDLKCSCSILQILSLHARVALKT